MKVSILPSRFYFLQSLNRCPGEGGSFALYQGLYPPKEVDADADRTLTGDFGGQKQTGPKTFKSKIRWPLLLWVCLRHIWIHESGSCCPVFVWNLVSASLWFLEA